MKETEWYRQWDSSCGVRLMVLGGDPECNNAIDFERCR